MISVRLAFFALLLSNALFAQQSSLTKGGYSALDLTLTSTAFGSGAVIPDAYTCKGSDTSPTVLWTGHVPQAVTFALIMDDPDAPAGTWVHWLIWNLAASTHALPNSIPKIPTLPSGAVQGKNDFGKIGYDGPCPPPGKTHRYFLRLYALDTKLALEPGATRKQLDAAMKGHIVAKSEHMGTYQR